MGKKYLRRGFIGHIALLSLGTALGVSCSQRKPPENTGVDEDSGGSEGPHKIQENRQMPRDLVMKLLDQKVDHYMQISNHCAQSSFMALTEQFDMRADAVLKALTPLPGVAERGETCGAVTGPLMVFGLIYGRGKNSLQDWDAYRASLVPSGKFCQQFETRFGSTMCGEIQKARFGRSYNLTEPEDLRAFQEADATKQCSLVVRQAVRLAAEMLLNDQNIQDEI
jgi:C_GCAxxG_C_C family probable redox protein